MASEPPERDPTSWWANARDVITFLLGVTGFIYEMVQPDVRVPFLVVCCGMMGLGKMLEVIARILEALVEWRSPRGSA